MNLRPSDLPGLWIVWWRVVLLGVTTIVSYGFVLYSFGVFVVPIEEDTGWSTSATLGCVLAEPAGWWAGRAGDRSGARSGGQRAGDAGTLLVGSALLVVAAGAQSQSVFILSWGIGAGIVSAGLFYNVTMAITARLFFDRRAQAFAGADIHRRLGEPDYFPLAGALVDALGWRDTVGS